MKSNYFLLWLLLALSLALVAAYSFIDDIPFDGWKPKKAPIAEKLTYVPDALSPDTIFSQSFQAALLASKTEVDSTAQTFLLIGDSMTLNLAYRLNDYAEQNGHKAYSVNWDSSNTHKWANSSRLQDFIDDKHPTIVLVSLGSNELFMKNPEALKPNIEKILAMIGDRPFIWIGPPNWKKDEGLNDMLEGMLPAGTYFRTEGMQLARRGDHIHPTREASEVWMDSIMRWSLKSSHPFKNDKPVAKSKRRSSNIYIFKPNE